jgi:hypothetical protein
MVLEDESDVITERLSRMISQENVIVLKYGPDITADLESLVASKHLFDAVLVDATESGFLFPAELLIDASRLAHSFLEVQGALVFLRSDKAVAIVRESLMGSLSFHIFDNHAELFDYSPPLAKHVQSALGKATGTAEESTDLAQQVLMSTVPVLTALGVKMKAGMDAARRRNTVIAAVDNYTPLSTISHRLSSAGKMQHPELIEELRGLEQAKAIYPIFHKIPFLVNCFRNQTPFTLKDYLISAKLVTEDQLDEMIFELQSTPVKERVTLGPLAVKKGFINTRQLEIALQDQAFYGQSGDSAQVKLVKTSGEETQVQSLVGHLGTTDPSNLLQNLATNRETGVLSVEYRDFQFRAQFDVGKLTHAKVGKVTGNKAVSEFASAWREGIFVFIQRTPPPDLSQDSCKLTKPLDKLLLDAALGKDNTDVILKKLPKGMNSVLEKVLDEDDLLNSGQLVDPSDKKPLSDIELTLMRRTHSNLDGLTSLSTVMRYLGDVTTYELARALDLLLHYQLANIPVIDLQTPLSKFQLLISSVSEKIGSELSVAFLRLALRDGIGYSGRARVFAMSNNGDIGVDMAAARQANASLSGVIQDLENWQVKYIEYVSQELDREVLLSLITEIHST